MTTEAAIGHGTLFQMLDPASSPPTYDVLAEVTSITPPGLSRDTHDATHTQSPEKWREFIAGLKDGGEFSVELNFVPGGSATLRVLASYNSDLPDTCRFVFPDGSPATTWQVTAFVTGFETEVPVDSKMTGSVTFKVTGKPGFVGA